MAMITFSPSTTIKSADVNANFTGLANGSLIQSGTNAIPGSALVLPTTSSSFSYSLNAAQISGYTATLVQGSSQNGTYQVDLTVNISALSLPSTAIVLGYQMWLHMAGNSTFQGYTACAVTSFSNSSVSLHAQATGNEAGYPNSTNSRVEGYVRYLA